jgi:sugar phosphate isomerase/epimerase
MDVCNIINSPSRYYNNGAIITECFRKLGKWTRSCHAKDLEWLIGLGVQFNFRETIPGRGQIDYTTYLKELANLPHQAPLMLEHLKTPEEYLEGANYIRRVAAHENITLG